MKKGRRFDLCVCLQLKVVLPSLFSAFLLSKKKWNRKIRPRSLSSRGTSYYFIFIRLPKRLLFFFPKPPKVGFWMRFLFFPFTRTFLVALTALPQFTWLEEQVDTTVEGWGFDSMRNFHLLAHSKASGVMAAAVVEVETSEWSEWKTNDSTMSPFYYSIAFFLHFLTEIGELQTIFTRHLALVWHTDIKLVRSKIK